MSKKQQFNYVTYGSKVNSEHISQFLNYMLDANVLNPTSKDRPTP
ncbi:MAG: hypothetical protein RL329_65, partial [Bacteroidota bacterium]